MQQEVCVTGRVRMGAMARNEVVRRLRGEIGAGERASIEAGTQLGALNDFNRSTLLRLCDLELDGDDGDGDDGGFGFGPVAVGAVAGPEVEEADFASLDSMLREFLAEHLPDDPDAQRWIRLSCLALAFVFREPMHPVDVVDARLRVADGAATYYCPSHTGSETLCRYCASRPFEELEHIEQQALAGTQERHGETSAAIQRALFDAGMLGTGVVPTAELRFHEETRAICAANSCGSYDTCWACPPAVGTLDECRERCRGFEKMQLFSRAYLLEDSFDFEGMSEAMADFKRRVLAAAPALRDEAGECLILSNEGCGQCASCTWPDAPCRFPDRLFPSIEGYGFVVSELAASAGIRYSNGPNTVTFFGAVLYNE